MRLPNGNRAILGTKLQDYVLNPEHLEGRHKARLFKSALDITLADAAQLAAALLAAAATSEQAIHKGHNGFGEIYSLKLQMTTESKSAIVQSAWIILDGEHSPRLVSCYIV